MTQETLLEIKNVHVHYGGVKALDGASIQIDEGEIVALMGPNGAGKSTILKTIFGLTPIDKGEVRWHGTPIKPVSHQLAQRGIAFVPQGRRVFTRLTVRENLEVGGLMVDRAERERRVHEVMEIFPALRQKQRAKSGSLSGGQQQMLALGRGLMADPKVLLLDEPSLGLSPKIAREVFAKITEINARHQTAVLIVEHNLKSVLNIAHRAYVLDKGRLVVAGLAKEVEKSGILEKVFTGKI